MIGAEIGCKKSKRRERSGEEGRGGVCTWGSTGEIDRDSENGRQSTLESGDVPWRREAVCLGGIMDGLRWEWVRGSWGRGGAVEGGLPWGNCGR